MTKTICNSLLLKLASPASEITIPLPFGRSQETIVVRWVFTYAGETDTGLQIKIGVTRNGHQFLHTVYDAALDADGSSSETYVVIRYEDVSALVVQGASAHNALDLMIQYEQTINETANYGG